MIKNRLRNYLSSMSIKKKFIATIVVSVLLTGILTTFFITTMLTKEFRRELDEKGVSLAQHLAEDSIDLILTEKFLKLQDLVDSVRNSEEVEYIYVLDSKGNVLVHTFESGFPKDLKKLDLPDETSIQLLDTEKGIIHDIAVPILGGEIGFIHLGMSESYIMGEITGVVTTVGGVVIFMSFFSIILASTLSSRITEPLIKLTESAREIGEGNLSNPIRVRANGEIGILSNACENMRRELNKKMEELKKARDELELRVKERTYELLEVNKSLQREIEERKKAEKSLKESENRLKTIMDSVQAGIFVIDENHTIIDANPAAVEMIGRKKEDIVSKKCYNYVCPNEKGKCPVADKGENVDNKECILLTKDGKIPILKTVSGMYLDGRKYFIESFVDISEQKRMEESLRNLNEVLKVLNKILRHDILNDLTVISNSIELYEEIKDKKLIKNALKSIEKSVELIKKMRELESLVSSGEGLKCISVRDVINEVVENYRNRVEFEIEGDCTVMADEAFSSVIDNIVRNAVVHGNADRISITIEKKDGECHLKIADNGSGIPDEIREDVFKEGFSYGDTRGTGLGLYIVRKTIERYGGSVYIKDNKPKGTVFILKLTSAENRTFENTVEFYETGKIDQ